MGQKKPIIQMSYLTSTHSFTATTLETPAGMVITIKKSGWYMANAGGSIYLNSAGATIQMYIGLCVDGAANRLLWTMKDLSKLSATYNMDKMTIPFEVTTRHPIYLKKGQTIGLVGYEVSGDCQLLYSSGASQPSISAWRV